MDQPQDPAGRARSYGLQWGRSRLGFPAAKKGQSSQRLLQRLTAWEAEDRDRAEQLLLREFDQAWAHYRQLVNARTQHLGFLIAGAFAIPPVLKVALDASVFGDWRIAIASLVGLVYTILATFVSMVVARYNLMLAHYRTLFVALRKLFYGGAASEADDLLVGAEGEVPRQLLSIRSASYLLAAGLTLLAATSTLLGASTAALAGQEWWLPRASALAIGLTAAVPVALVTVRVVRRRLRFLTGTHALGADAAVAPPDTIDLTTESLTSEVPPLGNRQA